MVVRTSGPESLHLASIKKQDPIEIDKMKSTSVSSGFMSLATKAFLPDFNQQLEKM